MYAVYGLDEEKKLVEEFVGYVPASFFRVFTDPTHWSVKVIDMPDGNSRTGRLFHRAFFVNVSNIRAPNAKIMQYMGINSCEYKVAEAMEEL